MNSEKGLALSTAGSRVVLAYGLVSAALYCGLMPIWEGFDELFHYGYVQSVAYEGRFPEVGNAALSVELWRSLDFAPVSGNIQHDLERPSTTFTNYFEFSESKRKELRQGLDGIARESQRVPSPRQNYEAKQAPLTYLLLAPFEWALSSAPLPLRVMVLRMILALTSVTLTWFGMFRLGRRLELPAAMTSAIVFILFSCQMTYGAVCHVANDALLGPWLLIYLAALIDAWEMPSLKHTATSAGLMAVGLLLKSSLIAFVPFVFVWKWRRAPLQLAAQAGILLTLAGPWYVRNLLLYQNLTATPETGGIGMATLTKTATVIPWGDSILRTMHEVLWKGNNSFTTFSEATLNVALALFGISLAMYAARRRRIARELIVLAAMLLYCAALTMITLSFFVSTKGAITAPMPWYTQILLGPLLAICFLGLSRWERWGRRLAAVQIVLWAYIGLIGWLAKLVPQYGGFQTGRAHLVELSAWYFKEAPARNSILSTLCPAPIWMIYSLLAAVAILTVAMAVRLLNGLRPAAG